MKLSLFTSATFLLLQLCSLTHATPKYKESPLANIISGRYIIEFDESYQGSSSEFISYVQSKLGPTINSHIKMTIAHDFDTSPSIFRGVSIALYDDYLSLFTKRDMQQEPHIQAMEKTVLQKLLQEHHVKHIYPVIEIPRPKVDVVMPFNVLAADSSHSIPKLDIPDDGPQLPFTHSMTQVDQVHTKLGLKGKGILVGIIDSGIDYNHPALGGGFGKGYLVRYGYDLVGNDFDARNPFSRRPHDTPLDNCKQGTGHGTHVAGIIAANDKRFNFTGVAPEVTLGAWRVFSCLGSTSNDILIQALLDAHRAGCDIINLSLGSPSNWPDDPTSLIVNKIAERGSIVVTAAGNDGAEGAFYVSAPGTASKTVAVASVDNIYNLQQVLSTETGDQYPYTLSSSSTSFPSGKLVNYLNKTAKFDACNGTEPDGDIKGKLVLVQRGDCTFDEKAATAKKYGAKAIVVYDNILEDSFVPQTLRPEIPLSAISLEAGLALKQLLNSNNYTDGIQLTFHQALTRQNVTTQYQISDFSSVGPLYDMSLKPDLAGPGGFIFSTLPINNGGYGILSGTSMAAPYISGAYALFLEKHGKNQSVDFLKEHFQNYAAPTHLINSFIDNPIRQGAGLLQLFDAIDQSTHVSPGSISFNDTDHRKPQTIRISNPSNDTVRYNVSHLPSISAAPYDTKMQGFTPLSPLHYAPDSAVANLTFSPTEITIPPGETVELTINVSSVSEYNEVNPFPVYGGYIQLSSGNDSIKPIHVPYIGVEGSLSQLPIFDETYPFLLPVNMSRGITEERTGFVIDRSSNSTNYVISVFRLLTGTSHLITEVWDSNSTLVGVYSDYTSVPRSLLNEFGYFFTERWNGTVLAQGNNSLSGLVDLGPGSYRLHWKALKLLSDPGVDESWESKISPPILIKERQF